MRFHQPAGIASSVATSTTRLSPSDRRMSVALWIGQGVMASVFLMAGSMKLVMPLDPSAMAVHLPLWFVRFLGVAEVLGAIGLIVPSVTRIRPGLTPLAACGLLVIMMGAVVVTLMGGGGVQALGPLLIGGVLATIVHGRTRRMPIGSRSAAPVEVESKRVPRVAVQQA